MFLVFYFSHICIFILVLTFWKFISADLNATGGTFPNAVYQESTFSYRFSNYNSEDVSYSALGSTTGKCNMMGYWHTGNSNPFLSVSTKTIDTAICTDKCTVSICGNSSFLYPRFDRNVRKPLVHLAGSDSILSAADYTAFPDLQMLPSVAGAVVPIYNIPELYGYTLVLSRSTIAAIFLGNIRYWNDPQLLRDNAGFVETILSGLQQQIQVVVRTDSSGTTEIFSTAASSFDPCCVTTPDYSFATRVGKGQTPKWCGPLTDEIQIITTSNCLCNSMAHQDVNLAVVGTNSVIWPISFNCNATANEVMNAFQSVYGQNSIKVTRSSASTSSFSYTIGYYGANLTTKNLHQPYPYSPSGPSSVTVQITTLQEGGYWNSHYNSSAYTITKEMQSLWINTAVNATFNISDPNSKTPYVSSAVMNPGTDNILVELKESLMKLFPNFVTEVLKIPHWPSPWLEFQLWFNTSSSFPKQPKLLQLHLSDPQLSGSVVITRYQTAYNYPLFYDSLHPQGYSGSGTYTCYKREHNYSAWSYHTGSGNKGVIAEVVSIPYAIGYSDLVDATTSNLARASIINRAGNAVVASGASVTYAAMELGGSLDSHFNAILADGASAKCWPMTGYTYFIIRLKTHLGTCEKRKEAMRFLYNFYYSDTVTMIALRLGYATLPHFVRSMVVTKLVYETTCNSGEYALLEYAKKEVRILSTTMLAQPLPTYLSAYTEVDSSISFNFTSLDDSEIVWLQYCQNPQDIITKYLGTFTMFLSPATKTLYYSNIVSGHKTLTTAFAHVAVVPLYHLNAYTAKSKVPLQVTAEILAKIYTGAIRYWNDSLLQLANYQNRKYLPYQEILVVVLDVAADCNRIFSRYLASQSTDFREMMRMEGADGSLQLTGCPTTICNNTINVVDNNHVDETVTFYDGSLGYFMLEQTPISNVAYFCKDSSCSNPIAPNNAKSITACESDLNTLVNVGSHGVSYDLMQSNISGCYPIVGTVDYTTVIDTINSTCSSISEVSTSDRVRFASWIFNGSRMVRPLTYDNMAGAEESVRAAARKTFCDVRCPGYLGYDYCSYRDCTWETGDYIQVVSPCDAATLTRRVTFLLTSNNTCVNYNNKAPTSPVYISCDLVMSSSTLGIGCYAGGIISILISLLFLMLSFGMQTNKKYKQSRPIFVNIFLIGTILLFFTSIFFEIGDITNIKCHLRIWFINIAITITYGPLILKLLAIEEVYVTKKTKHLTVPIIKILYDLFLLLLVDVLILSLWSSQEAPQIVYENVLYANIRETVVDKTCTSGTTSEIVMITYKLCLFTFGMIKAIMCWHVSFDINDSKSFAIVLSLGGLSYLLVTIIVSYTALTMTLFRCYGMLIPGIFSVLLLMVPKFNRRKKRNLLTLAAAQRGQHSSIMMQLLSGAHHEAIDDSNGEDKEVNNMLGNHSIFSHYSDQLFSGQNEID